MTKFLGDGHVGGRWEEKENITGSENVKNRPCCSKDFCGCWKLLQVTVGGSGHEKRVLVMLELKV